MLGECVRCRGRAAQRQIARGCHQHERLFAHPSLQQIGIGQRPEMTADRNVEAFLKHIDEAIGHVKLDLQLRIRAGEIGKPVCEAKRVCVGTDAVILTRPLGSASRRCTTFSAASTSIIAARAWS